jgi:multidrug efflux pump subunit AcrA (membrane-fusion protein)
VKTVERGTIEAGVAVSGDLKAIEEAVVRARLEGDLVGVYAREGDHVKEGQLLAGSRTASRKATARRRSRTARPHRATSRQPSGTPISPSSCSRRAR